MVGRERQQTARHQARCSQHLAEVTEAAQWKEQTKAAAAHTVPKVSSKNGLGSGGHQLGFLVESWLHG